MPSLGTSAQERQGTDRVAHHQLEWAVVAIAIAISIHLRWSLAGLADWGLDEASTIWLAWLGVNGHPVSLGLLSSRDIPNMSGAPLLTLPLALIASPVWISRALSLAQLALLLLFARALCRRGASSVVAVPVMVLMPALMLTSASLWNQYYATDLSALQLTLLVVWADRDASPGLRRSASAGYIGIGLLMPTVHLIGFTDLGATLIVCLAVWTRGPRAEWPAAPGWLIGMMTAVILGVLYVPWVHWFVERSGAAPVGIVLASTAIAGVGAVIALARAKGPLLQTPAQSRVVARGIAVLLWIFPAVAALSFFGAQIGTRLLLLLQPEGYLLLAAQLLVVAALLTFAPAPRTDGVRAVDAADLLRRRFQSPACAAIVIAHTTPALASRIAIMPSLLIGARPDLLASLVPGLLATMLLVKRGRSGAWPALPFATGLVMAVAASYWLAIARLDGVPQSRYPLFVPGSEMTSVVDRLAAVQPEQGTGGTIDVSYDLARGLDWVMHACGPARPWFTVGRQYDWLLLARHDLRNVHEGSCDRSGPARWQIGYRDAPVPQGMRVVERFEHVEIRARMPD
jgi:hypothetical protein